jgi:hypothetical protein
MPACSSRGHRNVEINPAVRPGSVVVLEIPEQDVLTQSDAHFVADPRTAVNLRLRPWMAASIPPLGRIAR